MHLVPIGELQKPLKHLSIGASLATFTSTSFAAPGTGMVYVPVHAWMTGSAEASVTYYNGTAGSALFCLKGTTGGGVSIEFWEQPDQMAWNKAPVLESNAGIGVHEFHVWAIAMRGGPGAGALTL